MDKDFFTLLRWLAGRVIDHEELAVRERGVRYRHTIIKYFPNRFIRPITVRVSDIYMLGNPTLCKYWLFREDQFPPAMELIDGLHEIGFDMDSDKVWHSYNHPYLKQPIDELPRFLWTKTEVVAPRECPVSALLIIYHSPVENKAESETFSKDVVV